MPKDLIVSSINFLGRTDAGLNENEPDAQSGRAGTKLTKSYVKLSSVLKGIPSRS